MEAGPTHVERLDPRRNLEQAEGALRDALASPALRSRAAEPGRIRIEQPISTDADLLAWLGRFPALPRFYWDNRGGYFALAGIGIAADVEGPDFSIIPAFVHAVTAGDATRNMRVLAWSRFDLRGRVAPEWAPFGRVRAVLPLLELRRTASQSLLAVNLPAPGADEFSTRRTEASQALRAGAPLRTRPAPKPPLDPHLDPSEAEWTEQVEAILEAIAGDTLEKVVLARRRTRPAEVDALDLLARRRLESPESFHALIEPVPFAAFLAATPERLYYRDGRQLETEALAGTRARADSEREDRALADELHASGKDRHEHDIVVREIVRRLTPLCDGVVVPPPPVVATLPHLHHLRTPLHGRLRAGIGDDQILGALHPTPAVCGMPTGVALHMLRRIEKFDRGLYSGPIGCFGPGDAEVAVGIRSALVRRDAVQLLAGAGIVTGSRPASEWRETIDKMKGLEHLLATDEPA